MVNLIFSDIKSKIVGSNKNKVSLLEKSAQKEPDDSDSDILPEDENENLENEEEIDDEKTTEKSKDFVRLEKDFQETL